MRRGFFKRYVSLIVGPLTGGMVLSACVATDQRPPAGTPQGVSGGVQNIPMREYVPDASRSNKNSGWGYAPPPSKGAAAKAPPPAGKPPAGKSSGRTARGSGTPPPDVLAPTGGAGALPSVPPSAYTPPSTQSATDRFKRDLLQPEVDRLRNQNALGRLDPIQQRDLMQREQELRQYGPR